MKIYEYDICDYDRGIIIAESYENAVALLNQKYEKVDLEQYDSSEIDRERYYYGGSLSEICDYDGTEKLVCVIPG